MAQQANVVANVDDLSCEKDECNICHCEFSIDNEGGVRGDIGIIPVAFCPTCHAGLHDLYTAWYGNEDD